jgi:sirohydrochlorin cobaltochelatase
VLTPVDEKRAPMAAAPMKFRDDGQVDWGNMWETFCVLAREGGPPHRPRMLEPDTLSNVESSVYRIAVTEITRGIFEVSRYPAGPVSPGWIAVHCESSGQARWLAEAILEENVRARAEGPLLLVPAGERYTIKGEIKSVITAVAKTTHYWTEHLDPHLKRALIMEDRIEGIKSKVRGLFGR